MGQSYARAAVDVSIELDLLRHSLNWKEPTASPPKVGFRLLTFTVRAHLKILICIDCFR